MSQTFGKIIKAKRDGLDISQRDLAKHLEINHTYLSKIENDKANYPPSLDLIKKLAKFCDRSPEEMKILAGRISGENLECFVELYKEYGDRFTGLLKKMHNDSKFAEKILEELKAKS